MIRILNEDTEEEILLSERTDHYAIMFVTPQSAPDGSNTFVRFWRNAGVSSEAQIGRAIAMAATALTGFIVPVADVLLEHYDKLSPIQVLAMLSIKNCTVVFQQLAGVVGSEEE
ncbi:MAG: hypothetical protein KJ556_20205 [Gammaproteobacteria bacterium]|nr:hypothetical protein [Gammaproteobacteria bacterium]